MIVFDLFELNPPSGSRIYGNRDIEKLGKHYLRHLNAMTIEGLHSKSEIAAELAWRDEKIEQMSDWIEDLMEHMADDPHPSDGGSEFYAEMTRRMRDILSENNESRNPETTKGDS